MFGQVWIGRAFYGVWVSAADPLLKHCLSTANQVQPPARLRIGSYVLSTVLLLLEKLKLLLMVSTFYCIHSTFYSFQILLHMYF
jgi:hypothetical protein